MSEYNQVIGIDHDLCLDCGECRDTCPMGCFDDFKFYDCGACGMCLEICPVDAIIFDGEG